MIREWINSRFANWSGLRSARRKPLLFEPLEPRLLLNGEMSYDLTGLPEAGAEQNLVIKLAREKEQVGGRLKKVDYVKIIDRNTGKVAAEERLADVSKISVRTGAGDDSVTILADSFAGLPRGRGTVPEFFIDTGKGQNDQLKISHGGALNWAVDDAGSGKARGVLEDGRSQLSVVWTGTERLLGGEGKDTLAVEKTDFKSVNFSHRPADQAPGADESVTLNGVSLSYSGFEDVESTWTVDLTDRESGWNLVLKRVGGESREQSIVVVDAEDSNAVLAKTNASDATGIILRTGDGDDRIRIDAASFGPGESGDHAVPSVSVDAGGGQDSLEIVNDRRTDWIPAGEGKGEAAVSLGVSGSPLRINFSGVESFNRAGDDQSARSGEAPADRTAAAPVMRAQYGAGAGVGSGVPGEWAVDLRAAGEASDVDREIKIKLIAEQVTRNGQTATVYKISILDVTDPDAAQELHKRALSQVSALKITFGGADTRVILDAVSFVSLLGKQAASKMPSFELEGGADAAERLAVFSDESLRWVLSGPGEGTLTGTLDGVADGIEVDFSGFETLDGGNGKDTLVYEYTDFQSITVTGVPEKGAIVLDNVSTDYTGFERIESIYTVDLSEETADLALRLVRDADASGKNLIKLVDDSGNALAEMELGVVNRLRILSGSGRRRRRS